MLRVKKNLKLSLIISAVAGLSLIAYIPVNASEEIKKETQSTKEVTVDKLVHDFGTIGEEAGDVSAIFVVTNNTDAPIVLTNVKATCGCTTPNWTKTPIEPGKTGEVTATYNPKGRPGPFDKVITITTNSTPDKLTVHIKGTVE
ncbi:MAG: DUF1573 domain-containing protein [Dysgonamonadaceae bacterium]|jgi:hypothetical protein|nr:DUF1573 domain-containing protein [Dysgonamonadaceae bacterium]